MYTTQHIQNKIINLKLITMKPTTLVLSYCPTKLKHTLKLFEIAITHSLDRSISATYTENHLKELNSKSNLNFILRE